MKWSAIVALFAGGLAVIVAFIAVQLQTLDHETDPADTDTMAEEKVETTSKSPTAFASGDNNGHSSTVTITDEQSGEPTPSTQASSNDATNDGSTTQTRNPPVRSDPVETAAIVVTGTAGNLTFRRQASAETHSPPIKATRISVVDENGDVFEFSSSSGQPVNVSENLGDGLYKWEAVHQPELLPRVREELTAARQSGDFEAERRLTRKFREQGLLPSKEETAQNVQSGSFRIVNGEMVEKDMPEEN